VRVGFFASFRIFLYCLIDAVRLFQGEEYIAEDFQGEEFHQTDEEGFEDAEQILDGDGEHVEEMTDGDEEPSRDS